MVVVVVAVVSTGYLRSRSVFSRSHLAWYRDTVDHLHIIHKLQGSHSGCGRLELPGLSQVKKGGAS